MSITVTDVVNTFLETKMRNICKELNVPFRERYLDIKLGIKKEKKKTDKFFQKRCQARVKNNGWGRQCSRNSSDSEFCVTHGKQSVTGKFQWEELGRITDCAPNIFIQWYKKKGYIVKNRENFYATGDVSKLKGDDLENFLLHNSVKEI